MTYLIIEANVVWNPTSHFSTVQEYFRVAGSQQEVLLVVTFFTLPPHSSICFEVVS